MRRYFVGICGCIVGVATMLSAAGTEPDFRTTPIVLSAAKVLPAGMLSGPNYKIKDAVLNDGLINMYDVDTKYGALKVESTCLLRKRVNELAAITQIEGIKKSDIYLNAVRQTAAVPVQTAKKLVTDPIGTTKQITSGISHFFTSVSSTVSNRSDSPENAMNSALGQSSYKRQFAYQFGVDPYSTYEPLQKALGDISWAAAAGGLTVKAAMMAIPGAAGAVVSATGTADTLQSLLRDKTAPELIQINEDRLHDMAVPETTIQVFMHNPSYDLQEQTLLVAALTAMTNVADRRSFMDTAAVANAESTGMFMRVTAQMLEHYNRRNPLARLITADGIPFALTAGGTLVGLFPLDHVAWTGSWAHKVDRITTVLRKINGVTAREFWLTGTVEPVVKRMLETNGWKVQESAEERLREADQS